MRSALFWIVAAIVIGAVVHLSYILVAPSLAMQRLMGVTSAEDQVNRFVLLDAEEQMRLLGEDAGESIAGKCVFDVSKGELLLTAEMPDTFWSLTVYSDRGADLYTINDRQAGTDSFKLSVKLAPGLIDLLQSDQSEQARAMSDGWSVEIPEAHGIAVFWVALDYPQQRKIFADALSHSSCSFTPK